MEVTGICLQLREGFELFLLIRLPLLSKKCDKSTVFLVIRQIFFFRPKHSEKSRSNLIDGSRSLGLFRKGKTPVKKSYYSKIS